MKEFLESEIKRLKAENLYRVLKTVEGSQGPEVVFNGKKYLNFSSNNYLGLANHPVLKKATVAAVIEYGTGSGASRLVTGSMVLHEKLEEKIAQFKGVEKALVFNSGYHANMGIISSLMKNGGFIFSDALNHASLIDGCRLSKAKTFVYRHNDIRHLEEMLNNTPSPPLNLRWGLERLRLIITDTVFSMDGDICLLPQIMNLAEKYDAWVLVDEAHATGVFGKKGCGIVEHYSINPRNPRLIQMGTFGKALGSFGAYVCGTTELIDYLVNRSRTFIYTTSLPPAVLAASMAAIQLIESDSTLREELWENVEYFNKALGKVLASSPIFPIIIGDSGKTMEATGKLFEKGIWAQGIRPPTVASGTSRIRLTIMATHTNRHLDRCLEALHCVLGRSL